jgi:hypothetical protein
LRVAALREDRADQRVSVQPTDLRQAEAQTSEDYKWPKFEPDYRTLPCKRNAHAEEMVKADHALLSLCDS